MKTKELNAAQLILLEAFAGTESQQELDELTQVIRDYYTQKLEEENETEYISKEEILAGIKAGLKDIKDGRTQSLDDFIKELEEEKQR